MRSEEASAEQIERFLPQFTRIYDDAGKETNPMPKGEPLTVYCDHPDERGFAVNTTTRDLGITAFIAKAWIRQGELERLMEAQNGE